MFRFGRRRARTLKRIRPIHAPTVQNADPEGVRRTMKGTASAHDTILPEMKLALFIDMDILYGTSLFALAAKNALVCFDPEEPTVYTHRNLFDT